MSSSSAQALAKFVFEPQPSETVGSQFGGDAHPVDVQTVQLGGTPASALASKFAKPSQMDIEAKCGTAGSDGATRR